MNALLLRVSRATPRELPAALWSFVYFYSLLAGYYVLRPIRDEMGLQLGAGELHKLFTAVFLTMLAVVPVFGWLTKRFPRRVLLPWIYGFFVANLLGFFLVMEAGPQTHLVATVFFVWVSVFNLFAMSVFWSFMADLFDTAQARRLYGFIAAGGSAGALTGPVITASLVGLLGARLLMLVAAGFLAISMVAIFMLRGWAREDAGHAAAADAAEHQGLGGSIWSGLVDVARSPYLLGIAAFMFLYSLLSTSLYFQQAEIVPKAISDSGQRTQLLAGVDLAVNVATLLIQLFAFERLIQRGGIVLMLAIMPALSIVGFAAVAISPEVAVLAAFGIVRRAGEYAISKPARETLFNVLPAEQKYRAKNVIDTVVHRGGDISTAWIFNGLRALGLGSPTLAWLAVPTAALWLVLSVGLGRRAGRLQEPRGH
jgi:AAA family ATP:ADP antiporter